VTGYLWAALGMLAGLSMTALGDMVSEEVRDRLDHLPHAILRLAARRLDPGQHITVYQDEWLPEITYILKGDEARPITRLFIGTRYALGILGTADRVARRLHRTPPPLTQTQPTPSTAPSAASTQIRRMIAEVEAMGEELFESLSSARAALHAAQQNADSVEHDGPSRQQALAALHASEDEVVTLVARKTKVSQLLVQLRADHDSLVDSLVHQPGP
jgi:hypothetical protein